MLHFQNLRGLKCGQRFDFSLARLAENAQRHSGNQHSLAVYFGYLYFHCLRHTEFGSLAAAKIEQAC